ncbi:MAG: class A beta-lactamase [Candidatus Eremiobacteraeota bacterium]|nr:class A beta-lactamase [Candidatus Eremiobacteraeota bacterium]
MDRTSFLLSGASVVAALGFPKTSFSQLEARYGGRLGVMAIHSGTGGRISHRSDERFPMCSTFKLLLVAAVLKRVDSGKEHLGRQIPYKKTDLLEYAPVTREHVQAGFMRVDALCAAAVEYSDNTAANLLLDAIGGPHQLTSYARSLGDPATRLDRNEPGLNSAVPGDVRDTTTPAAMAANLQKLLSGGTLSFASTRSLKTWLTASKTGGERIRAGVPSGWAVGDKTGTGSNGSTNDVAVLYPVTGSPIFVAAYYTGSASPADMRNHVLAEVGRIVASL